MSIPMLFPAFRFRKPTGPYNIGTLTYHFEDGSKIDIFREDPRVHRSLMVQIWYPTLDDSADRTPYLPDAAAVTKELARLYRLPVFMFFHIKHVRSNAIPSAAVATDQNRFPVLIFLEGLSGFRQPTFPIGGRCLPLS